LRSDEQEDSENPEEFYPDLEFIDYSDPNDVIDQGMGDELLPTPTAAAGRDNNNNDDDDTEQQIEAMREDRRRRNERVSIRNIL
jgi:hypothetical protein